MAEMDYSSAQLIAQSKLAQLPAARGLDIFNEMFVLTPYEQFIKYLGTRAALEAEGLIPSETVWPNGFDSLAWTSGGHKFWLRRERPLGVKGPRRNFLEVNWWQLHITPIAAKSRQLFVIERKDRDLREAIYLASAEGRAERSARYERHCIANRDAAFKSFMASIPGIDGRMRQLA